ncbi:peptide-methionine (S)-S-oxide reductase MsrA [Cesiribacter andamanensis]|uniref:Peptide methionine sulfoxide reductase MsrA n=1 Tax=Cesiribacter andamanensis AMV16 TaxID=1279009 RepID=M7N6M0_9BACT|nr:peptide-methionine (S)-S-oxide reductase MsrA [Cesiribacter andamanensis]EMR02871.1 Peptide methionine sulfoxide reductase MsrA [Cesiribacter andamanensis AMV16]
MNHYKPKKKNNLYLLLAMLAALQIGLWQEGGATGSALLQKAPAQQQADGIARAVFASGCFWCTEAVFERVEGVQEVVSGYAGGTSPNPTYKKVSAGLTDYAEAVLVYYDSTKVSYETLLEVFFHSHDPTQLNRQGPDIGKQYRSSILYNSRYQEQLARAYMARLSEQKVFPRAIVTQLEPLTKFWRAEAYHQDYYELHPDDPYIKAVSAPKVRKFEKEYPHLLKKSYRPN